MIAFLLGPIGRYLLIAGVVMVALGSIYTKGRVDGKASYQAKLLREINAAIEKGDTARTEALKKFDTSKEIPDDEFSRPD